MHQVRNLTEDIYYLGQSDRRLRLFENSYPLPNGIAYNSYLIMDDKTVLLDTVDKSVAKVFFESLAHVLGDRKLDYLVINHMEPDHAATLEDLIIRYPEVTIVGNAKTFAMIRQFFNLSLQGKMMEIKEGDILNTGKHELKFYMAAMVHWPEVMVTYDMTAKALFSADAFGTFGALSGNIFADEMDFEHEWLSEARRYYANIVGKYGVQTQALLNKTAGLDIDYLCPLHGPIWRVKKKIEWFIEKYSLWATYTPEDDDVVIFYGSVYGGTEDAANVLAMELAKRNIKHIKMYDVSATEVSTLLSETFRAKVLVFAASTYNGGIFTNMETLITDMKAHNLQNRDIAIIENGSWALSAAKKMIEEFSSMKNMRIMEEMLTIKSELKENQLETIYKMADKINSIL